jgi:selenophosphate synthase
MVSIARFSSSGVIFFCFCAVVKIPIPKGLVRYILSPTLAVEFSFKCLTGFGLGGHLSEVCLGSGVSATINYNKVPILPNIKNYLANGCSPGGAQRNFDSYGHHLSAMSDEVQSMVCDPQTSGGLLIMVSKCAESEFHQIMHEYAVRPLESSHWLNNF